MYILEIVNFAVGKMCLAKFVGLCLTSDLKNRERERERARGFFFDLKEKNSQGVGRLVEK